MVIDVATYGTVVSICIAVGVTVVFTGVCFLYVLKRAKLI